MRDKKSFIVAYIPAYKEESNIGRVVLLARKYVDRVVVYDDVYWDLTASTGMRLDVDKKVYIWHLWD